MAEKGDCEFLEGCPMFKKFKLESTKSVWISYYCKGSKQADCARKKLRLAGKPVPENLLPDGSYLPEK